jgi:tRNA(fMet)-specific endonuclease VapC
VRYLLDTNICIAWLKGEAKVKSRLSALSPDEAGICSVVKAELLYGALRSARRAHNELSVRTFLKPFRSLAFDDASAERYAIIRATLDQAGSPIGPNDLMIASIAAAYGLAVVTRNVREFERIPGLHCEEW